MAIPVCKHCGIKHKMYASGSVCYLAYFYIRERDLLKMAQEQPGWRALANKLGFKNEKIDTPWTFADEGRMIPYRNILSGEFL